MVAGFTFDEKTHKYYLDGKKMTGCTSVLGVIAKPALIQWAADMAAAHGLSQEKQEEILKRYLEAHALTGYDKSNAKKQLDKDFPLYEECRKAHTKVRDIAADSGTDIHGEIETVIKEAIETGGGYISKTLLILPHPEKQVQHFIDWANAHNVKFLASERKVYSASKFVAGTYDFKCEIDGKVYMGDIKTTSAIYDRLPFAQTAAYQFMEAEMDGTDVKDVHGRVIINLKKDGTFDEEADVYYSYDYDTDIELFMSALSIYRIMNNY